MTWLRAMQSVRPNTITLFLSLLFTLFLITTPTLAVPTITTTSISNKKLTVYATFECSDTGLASCVDVSSVSFSTAPAIDPISHLKLQSIELFTCVPPNDQGEPIEWVIPRTYGFNEANNNLLYNFKLTDGLEKTPFTSSLTLIATITTNHDPIGTDRKFWNPQMSWDGTTDLSTTMELVVNGLNGAGEATTSILSITAPLHTSNTPTFDGSQYTAVQAQNRDNSVITDGAAKRIEYEWSANAVMRCTAAELVPLPNFSHLRIQSRGPIGFRFVPQTDKARIQINGEFHPLTVVDSSTIDIEIAPDTKLSLLALSKSISFSLSHPIFKLNSDPAQIQCLSYQSATKTTKPPGSLRFSLFLKSNEAIENFNEDPFQSDLSDLPTHPHNLQPQQTAKDQIVFQWDSPITYQSSYAILPRQVLSYAFFEPYNYGLYMTTHVLNFAQGRNALNRVAGLNLISYPYSPDIYANLDTFTATHENGEFLPHHGFVGNSTQDIIVSSYANTIRTFYNGPYASPQISNGLVNDDGVDIPGSIASSAILSELYLQQQAQNAVCFFGMTVYNEEQSPELAHNPIDFTVSPQSQTGGGYGELFPHLNRDAVNKDGVDIVHNSDSVTKTNLLTALSGSTHNEDSLAVPESLHFFKFNLTADQIYKVAENTRQYLPNIILETYGNLYSHVWSTDHNYLFLNFSSTSTQPLTEAQQTSYFYSQVPIHRFLPITSQMTIVRTAKSLYYNETLSSNPDRPNYYPRTPQSLLLSPQSTPTEPSLQSITSSFLTSLSTLLSDFIPQAHAETGDYTAEPMIEVVKFQLMVWRWNEAFATTPSHLNYLHLSLPFFDSYFILHYPWWDEEELKSKWDSETLCELKYGPKSWKLTYHDITAQIYLDLGSPLPPKIDPIYDTTTKIPLNPVKQIKFKLPQWLGEYMTKKRNRDLDFQCNRIDIAVLKDNTQLINYPTRVHPYSIPIDSSAEVLQQVKSQTPRKNQHSNDLHLGSPIVQCFNTFAQTSQAYLSVQISRHIGDSANSQAGDLHYIEASSPTQTTTSFSLGYTDRQGVKILLWVSYGILGLLLFIYLIIFAFTVVLVKNNKADDALPGYSLSRHHTSGGYGSIQPEQELVQSESTVGHIVTVTSHNNFPGVIGSTSPQLVRRPSLLDRRNSNSLLDLSGGSPTGLVGSQPIPVLLSQHRQGSNPNLLSPTIVRATSISSSRQLTPNVTVQPGPPTPSTPNIVMYQSPSPPSNTHAMQQDYNNENSDESTVHANVYVDLDDATPFASPHQQYRSSLSIGPQSRAGALYGAGSIVSAAQTLDENDQLGALFDPSQGDHKAVDQPSYGD